MTNHQEFERLAETLQPDPAQRHTILRLAELITHYGVHTVIEADRGDADQVIRNATIVAAHCYQIVLQLGGDLDQGLRRFREETVQAAVRHGIVVGQDALAKARAAGRAKAQHTNWCPHGRLVCGPDCDAEGT